MIEGPVAENRECTEVILTAVDLVPGSSESKRQKTAETLLNILEGRIRNKNTRSAYKAAWRSFFEFCTAYKLELERVKPYHFGLWLKRHPGSIATQRQHLAAVRLLFDHLLEKGVVELNPAARAKPPRLEREASHTPVFEEDEIKAFLSAIKPRLPYRHSRQSAVQRFTLQLGASFCRRGTQGRRLLPEERGALAAACRKAGEDSRGAGSLEGQRSHRPVAYSLRPWI